MRSLMQILRSLVGIRGGRKTRRPTNVVASRFRPAVDELEARWVPSVTLGSAANYGVLGLVNTSINNSNVTISGNEGVSQGGKLTNQAPSTITGNAYEYAVGQYSGPGKLGGSVVTNPTLLAQNDADALNAASQAEGLAPTQTLGTVAAPTTVTGNGGLNVIAVNGDINSSLILSGSASDVFVVNVSGSVSLGGSTCLGLNGGVTADHVLYNFTGTTGSISTHVGNVLNGTLLAPTYSFSLDGLFNGEIIGGGKTISLLSGAQVNQVPFAQPQAATASISGSVVDQTQTGVAGVTITLSGTDANGNSFSLSTMTDGNGNYAFLNVPAGTDYTLTEDTMSLPFGVFPNTSSPGTVNGTTDGSSSSSTVIGGINLNGGDAGINYDFSVINNGGAV